MATTEIGVHDSVKDYYGNVRQRSDYVKTETCTSSPKQMLKPVREALAAVHDEVTTRYYGCGMVIPEKVENIRILDLGSGSGRDCFALSKLVGQNGYVVGIDMTDEQLQLAHKHIDYHTKKFGFSKPNVEFVKGYIEKLTEAGLKEKSFDVIVSNCVINLSPDKRAALREALKVLKIGGELYFSDIYTDRDIPETARKHQALWGECISGALWWKELYSLTKEIGFSQPRLVAATHFPVTREDFRKLLGDARFVSVTYRLFKLPEKEEPSRQVIYNGKIPDHKDELKFDYALTFKTGEVVGVDSEMSTILSSSRFKDEFEFQPCPPGASCVEKFKVDIDPWEYIAQQEEKGELQSAGLCSGPKKKCS